MARAPNGFDIGCWFRTEVSIFVYFTVNLEMTSISALVFLFLVQGLILIFIIVSINLVVFLVTARYFSSLHEA